MIESIEFVNFKALRKTSLPLAPFTLLLGPNGSGKSSVLQTLERFSVIAGQQAGIPRQIGSQVQMTWSSMISVAAESQKVAVEVKLRLRWKNQIALTMIQ